MAAPNLKAIPNAPEVLRQRDQWVLWRYEERQGKRTKVPYNPRAAQERRARSDTPATWGTFAQALTRYQREAWDGIGYVFAKDDPFVGVDLDHCIDSETGIVTPAALDVVRTLDSYTEISPSGLGLHIFTEATLPLGRRVAHDLGIEMYGDGRFFTITGRRLSDTVATINARQDALEQLHKRFFGAIVEHSPKTILEGILPADLDDRSVIDLASGATNGPQFYHLWRGDFSSYPSKSEADLALCNFLAFWTHDVQQTDRLFRQSGLYTEKWDTKHYADGRTYGQGTIEVAFAGRTEFYQAQRRTKTPVAPTPIHQPRPIPTEGGDPNPIAADQPATRYRFWSDIQVQDLPPLTWVVDKILAEACLSVIYGEPWTGKSFLALDLACHVAEGVQWCGRKVTQGPVVYIAAEGMRGMQLRIKAWKLARHIPLTYSIPIHFLGVPVPLLDTMAVAELLVAIRALPDMPKLIILDTLGRSFIGGEENSNDDMNQACNAANILQQETGANVVFVHHKGKNNPTMRGASALLGGVDTAIEVTKEETSPLVTLTCRKQKDGAEPFSAISMRLKPLLVDERGELTSCVLVPVDASARLDELKGPDRVAFMAIAGEFDHARGATLTEWLNASRLAKQTFYDARSHLVTQDYVMNPEQGRGSHYKLSSKGIDWYNLVRRESGVLSNTE